MDFGTFDTADYGDELSAAPDNREVASKLLLENAGPVEKGIALAPTGNFVSCSIGNVESSFGSEMALKPICCALN